MRKLQSVEDLLEAMKEARGWVSDSDIARGLKVPQPTVATWRIGTRSPGDDHALKIAEALDVSPLLVIAISAAERAKSTESANIWRKMAEQAARGVVPTLAALALITGTFAPEARAQGVHAEDYGKRRRRRPEGRVQGMPDLPQPA